MRGFEASHRFGKTRKGDLQKFRLFLFACRFVGGSLDEAGDAFRVLGICFGESADFGFKRRKQVQQFGFCLIGYGPFLPYPGFNLLHGLLNHRTTFVLAVDWLTAFGFQEKMYEAETHTARP